MQTFYIAGITLGITAAELDPPEPSWQKFSTKQAPDLLYEVRYAPTLPSTDSEPFYRDDRVRLYRMQCGILRVYSDLYTHRDTVSVLERAQTDDCLVQEITVSQHRYPWGTTAAQLYEILDLQHYLLRFRRLLIHGAYVLHEGRAIIFTAPSGVGKSTQAELWRQHCGAAVINGDRVVIGFENGRLMAYGFPFSGSSDDCENVDAPVAAIVSLSQAKENRLQRLNGIEALRQLLRGVYLQPENQTDLPKQFDFVAEVVQKIPIYHLACLPDQNAAQLLRVNL